MRLPFFFFFLVSTSLIFDCFDEWLFGSVSFQLWNFLNMCVGNFSCCIFTAVIYTFPIFSAQISNEYTKIIFLVWLIYIYSVQYFPSAIFENYVVKKTLIKTFFTRTRRCWRPTEQLNNIKFSTSFMGNLTTCTRRSIDTVAFTISVELRNIKYGINFWVRARWIVLLLCIIIKIWRFNIV